MKSSEWRVAWQYIASEKIWQVYRTIDKNDIDHAGNREYAPGTFPTEYLAQDEADRLNGVFHEDKVAITAELFKLFRMFRQFQDLESMEYKVEDNGAEFVVATFANGAVKRANVTADSGIAMMGDVRLYIGGI